MGNKLESKIFDNINQSVIELGFEIEYIEYVKEGTDNILRIVIDNPNGMVNVDDCEIISRKVEPIVEKVVDETLKKDNEYILEVASSGLERQLKNLRLYKKYINNEIYVKLFKKIDNEKEIIGKLISVDEENNNIVIEAKENTKTIEIKNISTAHTTYDFGKIFNENKN